MSYLQHILGCNQFNPEKYFPFIVGKEQMGWVRPDFVNSLLEYPEVFQLEEAKLFLHPQLKNPQARTDAIAPVLRDLHDKKIIKSWVGEPYAVCHNFTESPRFLMERASVSHFGVRGFGVHVNGLVKKSGCVFVWVAKRTIDKPFWPGKLDQMVAGGQPAGIGRLENVVKEAAEEAAVPKSLARKAELVGELHYCGESSAKAVGGLNIDTLFVYDLWLPEAFEPQNTDGEVDEFTLMPLTELAQITDQTNNFKDNCNLVNIDLSLRMGEITSSHPDYDVIRERLYAPADICNKHNNEK